MNKIYQWLIIGIISSLAGFTPYNRQDFDTIRNGFINPPDSIRVSAFYYWLNNHISNEGVIKDLHAMKKAGITGLLGPVALFETNKP